MAEMEKRTGVGGCGSFGAEEVGGGRTGGERGTTGSGAGNRGWRAGLVQEPPLEDGGGLVRDGGVPRFPVEAGR